MAKLEDFKAGTTVKGLSPIWLTKVVQVERFGDQAVEVTYKDSRGAVAQSVVYRNDEPNLEIAEPSRPWSFDGDGHLFHLASGAYRIRLA